MHHIKKIAVKYLCGITLIMVAAILAISTAVQMYNAQRFAKSSSESTFYQIEQVLAENQKELESVKETYRNTCLYDAEGIAYILQANPEFIYSMEDLEKITEFMEVDEIHIIDPTGRIYAGTHPEYYGLTFDSGDQISFFKPMLEDKTLKLCQEITPNTAEGKLMQYSALWSESGEFIVQVGMEPVNVMEATRKNELSYIFSLLRVNSGVSLYAADPETGEIMGSSVIDDLGKNLSDIGISMEKVRERPNGFSASVNGIRCFCIFREIGGNLVGRVITNGELYRDIPSSMAVLAAGLVLISIILVAAVSACMNKYVINGIYDVNAKLRSITDGDLDEKVDVQSSIEFAELSSHINDMIKSLLSSTDKMSLVLNRAKLHIGVYEYSENMKRVRFTEHIPDILALDNEKAEHISSDYTLFRQYIEQLKPADSDDGTFILEPDDGSERYIKLEEITIGNDVMGIVMDVTDETVKRMQLEAERDRDLLTGLYNRRGLENKLEELFGDPDKTNCGALVMIDADGLKMINDKYGHDKGDIYLRSIAGSISSFGSRSCLSARQGGDEFVLFLYGYISEEELEKDIEKLTYIQNNSIVRLDADLCVPMRFSFGFSMTKGKTDHRSLLKQADEKMYQNKSARKKADAPTS